MKKEKLKSKLANSARAFLRSFELKHRHRQPSSPPSSTEDQPKAELVLNTISPTTHISISQIPRVEKLNPRDLIVHRVLDTDDRLPGNYFQQKYRQYSKPSLLFPKQYYNELLNKRNYSSFVNRYDFCSPPARLSPNLSCNHIPFSSYRPLICREIKSSSHELPPPLQPSSMLKWNECVHRLNTEYRLTIEALEQAKEYLTQLYSNGQYSLQENLSIDESKTTTTVTFCLPSPSPTPSISKNSIEQSRILPAVQFSRPKLIKPVQLDTFISSLNLESELSIDENEEELYSICHSSKDDKSPGITPQELDFQEEETTYTIETFYTNQKSDLTTSIDQHIVLVQEKSTEEQFNRAGEQIETNSNTSKPPKKSISRIPISTTSVSRLKQIKPPSASIVPNTPRGTSVKTQPALNKSESATRVKTLVRQFNNINSNKRLTRPHSIQTRTSFPRK